MRKILFISAMEYVPWGGSELCWSAAAEKLARRGVEVTVSVKGWEAPVKEIEHLRSVGCRIVCRRPRQLSLLQRLGRKLFPEPEYVAEHVRTLGGDADLIVISQGINTEGIPWMEAANRNGYKYAVVAHGASERFWPDDDLAGRLAECFEGASAAYFVSQATLNLSRNQFAASLLRGRVIRNPFNVRYDARPAWPAGPLDALSLACVARLDAGGKGHDLLLEVLGLPHWRNREIKVSLVGSGPCERGLRRFVDKLGLTNVEFVGQVTDIEDVWSRHHALVLPSRHEGMPLALVEAMLCGRPSIVTDVGGTRELIRDGINGFLAKAPTVEFLDEAMTRAWDSRDQLMDMGHIAATDVRQWVSRDPTEEFIRNLTALVDSSEKPRNTETGRA
jgi:glycosyltransferase involved in cell wall biosynthesis